MPDAIRIRPATPADRDAVNALLLRACRALPSCACPPALLNDVLPLIACVRPGLLGRGTYFLAVGAAGTPLAVGGWSDASPQGGPGRAGRGHIRFLATDPDHQGRGFGRGVMQAVLRSASAAGVSALHCQSPSSATDFYRGLGFVARGRIEVRVAPGRFFPAVDMVRDGAPGSRLREP